MTMMLVRSSSSAVLRMASRTFVATPASPVSLADRLSDASLLKTKAFVAGEWVDTGASYDVADAASGEVVCQVSACGAREVAVAVTAADAAGRAWSCKVRERVVC